MQNIMRGIIFTIISEELDYTIFYKFLVYLSYTVALIRIEHLGKIR